MQLNGKTIAVTGASGGIGRPLVALLQQAGAKVIAIGRKSDALPSSVRWIEGDLSSAESTAAIAQILGESTIDSFIHLAGVQYFGTLESQDVAHLYNTFHVGVIAPAVLLRALLPQMKRRNSGAILLVGSTFASIPFAHFATYSSAKAALKALAQALRRELADTALRVTYVAPRAVDTPMNNDKVRQFGAQTNMAMDHPEWVAAQIIAALTAEKQEVFLGFPEKLFVKINALFPQLVSHALKKNNRIAADIIR